MSDEALVRLFDEFDRGHLSRRQLLQALGVAAVVRPASAMGLPAFGQGSCGPTRAGTPNCNTTPAKLPFEPTGWSTVLLDHFTMRVADYEKEVAYYSTLMNWKLRSDDGKQAMMDIGDFGGVLIIGGYRPPAPPPPPPAPPAPPPDAAGAAGAAGAPAAGRGQGRGGGRGPRTVVWDSFCWGIQPWDAKKVEAELRKRGLDPIADNSGKDFQSFHVKDPDGFDVQISNGSTKNRRTSPAAAKLQVPAPFEATDWKTVWLDHISFQVTNYKESAAFYNALLGWKLREDEGSQNEAHIGEVGGIIIRGRTGMYGATPPGGVRHATIDHISFGITPFDPDAVKAELTKRNLSGSADTGNTGDIHTSAYKSYHTNTPNGFNLQISNLTHDTRDVA